MKKSNIFIGIIVGLLMVPALAGAGIAISWFWDDNAAQPVCQNDGSTWLPSNSIVQLIYTPEGINTGYNPFNPLLPNEGNTVLATMGTTGAGWWIFPVTYFGDQYAGGYVFQRVFDTLMGNAPVHGSLYADGVLSDALHIQGTITPLPPNQSWFFASLEVEPFFLGPSYILSERLVVIPEPTTWALFGLGVLGLLFYRRRT